MGKKIILTAAQHNWGLHSFDDWQKNFYILYDNGDLRVVVYEGTVITEENYCISDDNLRYVQENIEHFIMSADENDACDGEAWEFESGGTRFDLGYIYGSDLEKIAGILVKARI